MANCSWKFGCTIYWGVAFCSTIFLIALYFQQQYIIPTDAYLYCEKLLKIDFTLLICFAIVAILFAKSRVRGGVIAFGILAASGGLLLFSLYTLFLVETVTFPKMDEALEIVRKRYAVDENILGYVQRKHKCCGIRNFTDWREIISKQQGRSETEDSRIQPAVVPSCCKTIKHCGVRLYRQESDAIRTSELNGNAGKLIPYVHNVADYIHTNGCYSYLKVNANSAYDTMRIYSFVAFLFVVSVAIVFSYYWRKKTAGSRISRGWPSPPMDVNSVVYDRHRGILIAYINPFMNSVIRRAAEPEENSASSSQGQQRGSNTGIIPASSSSSDSSRAKPVRFVPVT